MRTVSLIGCALLALSACTPQQPLTEARHVGPVGRMFVDVEGQGKIKIYYSIQPIDGKVAGCGNYVLEGPRFNQLVSAGMRDMDVILGNQVISDGVNHFRLLRKEDQLPEGPVSCSVSDIPWDDQWRSLPFALVQNNSSGRY